MRRSLLIMTALALLAGGGGAQSVAGVYPDGLGDPQDDPHQDGD